MPRSLLLLSLAVLLAPVAAWANPEVPGAPQQEPVALVGGTVHPVSGPAIENAIVLFDKGKITAVGTDVSIPDDCQRVDCTGKHIYPGLIDANSQLGLVEVSSVAGSIDEAETGTINPNVRAEVAVNPDSELIPVAHLRRRAGRAHRAQRPLDQRHVRLHVARWLDVGRHVPATVGRPARRLAAHAANGGVVDRSHGQRPIRVSRREAQFHSPGIRRCPGLSRRQARQRRRQGSRAEHDARWEAMIPVFDGKLRVFIEAEEIQQIQAALAFAEQQGIKPVIVGGYDAAECVPLLKKLSAPVIIGGVHRTPERRHDAYDSAFTLPERLRAAGVPFCIAGVMGGSSGSSSSNARNLPDHAGTAVAYGLPADEALKAITLYPAQILGVADRMGSIEPEKDATLIVTNGDILEIPTQVTAVYIQGAASSMLDRHKRLWEKYKEKYRRMGIEN